MEIIKELGYGMFGTVYKIKYNSNYYAMKIEHILESDKIKSLSSPIWKEIDFAKKILNRYPDQFIKLHKYEFIENCDHVQKYSVDPKEFSKYNQNKLKELSKSKLCIRKIYDLIDGNITDIIDSLTTNQLYSMIAQLALIIKILQDNKYMHGDIHRGNLGYIKTNKEYVKYKNIKIPTYGYIFKAIDYGSIIHPKYKNTKAQKELYKKSFGIEYITIFETLLINKTDFFDFAYDNNINLAYPKDKQKIVKSELKDIISEYSKNPDLIFLLAHILFPEKFQEIIFGKKNKEFIPIIKYLDDIDYIFMITCEFDVDKIIDYALLKLQ